MEEVERQPSLEREENSYSKLSVAQVIGSGVIACLTIFLLFRQNSLIEAQNRMVSVQTDLIAVQQKRDQMAQITPFLWEVGNFRETVNLPDINGAIKLARSDKNVTFSELGVCLGLLSWLTEKGKASSLPPIDQDLYIRAKNKRESAINLIEWNSFVFDQYQGNHKNKEVRVSQDGEYLRPFTEKLRAGLKRQSVALTSMLEPYIEPESRHGKVDADNQLLSAGRGLILTALLHDHCYLGDAGVFDYADCSNTTQYMTCDFTDLTSQFSKFDEAWFAFSVFDETNFTKSVFHDCSFYRVTGIQTNLSEGRFLGNKFVESIFVSPNVTKTDFSGAEFTKFVFSGESSKAADLSSAIFNSTSFDSVAFRDVQLGDPSLFAKSEWSNVTFIRTTVPSIEWIENILLVDEDSREYLQKWKVVETGGKFLLRKKSPN